MLSWNRCAKVNVKVLAIVILVVTALGASLFAARHVRREILSKRSLTAGEAAFEKKDWPTAYREFREYLGRNPDDVEILKKYAKARMSIRPLDSANIGGAITAYRRLIQLVPLDKTAYDKVAKLYSAIGNFNELAYIARTRLEHAPDDREAPLWLADGLIGTGKMDEARQTLEKFIDQLDALADKHTEYVRACVRLSGIVGAEDSPGAKTKALELLNKAADYAPESVEALAYRARFYRVAVAIPGTTEEDISAAYGMTKEDMLAAARKDLEAADDLGTDDPRIRSFLCSEWILHGELDLAAAELRAVESLTQEAMEEHFFDISDWVVIKFFLASELAARKAAPIAERASLADEALRVLTETRHRLQIIPSAIGLYVTAGRVLEARQCLDEYLDSQYTVEGTAGFKLRLTYLRALVAKAEEKPYVVIDVLQPAVVSDASRPELWRLLAEAYSRTDQPRRSVGALLKYLRLRPQDPEMTLQLAKEYLKMRDWNRAFETARLAGLLDTTNIIIKLLRLEAGIYLAVDQSYTINEARLAELSTDLAELREENLDRVDIRILQAIIANYLKEPAKAEAELKLAIEECKEPLRAEMQLVSHYRRTKRMTQAVSACEDACENHSAVAEPWLSLSGLHVANADPNSARSCLREGLDAVIGRWEKRSISMRLALLELMHADRAAGISILNEIAAQDEQEIRARSLLLSIREVREDQPAAEKLVAELREAEGESGLMWRLHEASLWLSSDGWRSKQPDITDALQYCIDLDPQWSAPVLLLVQMYDKLADFRHVEDTCRQALTRNPSATDVADRLVTLLEKENRFSDAENVLQQIETNPRAASAWNVRIALSAGNFSRAIDELELRVSSDDGDANSRILLARLVYQQTSDASQALPYLEEAEAITSNSMALIAARVAILRAEGQTEETQQILDDYVANNDVFGAYMMRAAYLANEGQFERAEKDYKKLTTFADRGATGYELLSGFYARNEKLDEAAATLEEGLKAYPENLRLKRILMKTLLVQGRAEGRLKALDILAALEKRLPQDPELMKLRALQILEELTPESRKAAREILEDVIRLEPTAVDAHLVLIGIAMQEREYEVARDSAIRALGSNPDNLVLLSARGGAELAMENTQMAAELARVVLQKDPNNIQARDVLVTAALNSADRTLLEEARTLVESAAGRDPTNENLLIARARVLVAMELPETAIPQLEAYCQTEEGSSSVPAIVTLADLYRLAGDMDKSKERIEQAERMDPNSQTVVHARFLWLVSQKRFDELAEISSTYISAKDQNPTTLVNAASILAALDSMELKKEGIKLFEHALTLSPTSMDARIGRASTLYQTGNAERAEKLYQELFEQYPNDTRIINDLAWILQEHYQRYPAALKLADRGLALAPNDLHLLDTRGTILSNLPDRLAEARSDFQKLVGLSPPDPRRKAKALLQLARVCAKLNDLVQAKQHLNNALEIDQNIDVFTTDERSEIKTILQK